MSYFSLTEFISTELLNNQQVSDRHIVSKINFWINELNKVRSLVGFPIKITDCVRIGDGESQHYFHGQGAVDLRPLSCEPEEFIRLALALCANPNIKRVCYYPPGNLFQYGGFHVDCKTTDKRLFVSDKDKVKWEKISQYHFIKELL